MSRDYERILKRIEDEKDINVLKKILRSIIADIFLGLPEIEKITNTEINIPDTTLSIIADAGPGEEVEQVSLMPDPWSKSDKDNEQIKTKEKTNNKTDIAEANSTGTVKTEKTQSQNR